MELEWLLDRDETEGERGPGDMCGVCRQCEKQLACTDIDVTAATVTELANSYKNINKISLQWTTSSPFRERPQPFPAVMSRLSFAFSFQGFALLSCRSFPLQRTSWFPMKKCRRLRGARRWSVTINFVMSSFNMQDSEPTSMRMSWTNQYM